VSRNYEGTAITCNGYLQAKGDVSANIIKADGAIVAHSIVGDSVKIHSKTGGIIRRLVLGDKDVIDLIEATVVELRGVRALQVNGHDVRIGPKCEIERVDCSGTLVIDARAKVGQVTGAGAEALGTA